MSDDRYLQLENLADKYIRKNILKEDSEEILEKQDIIYNASVENTKTLIFINYVLQDINDNIKKLILVLIIFIILFTYKFIF